LYVFFCLFFFAKILGGERVATQPLKNPLVAPTETMEWDLDHIS
jgi:hypothetical protein